jgi:hypothetical protein
MTKGPFSNRVIGDFSFVGSARISRGPARTREALKLRYGNVRATRTSSQDRRRFVDRETAWKNARFATSDKCVGRTKSKRRKWSSMSASERHAFAAAFFA